MSVHMYVHVCVWACGACLHASVCVCMCVCLYTCVYACVCEHVLYACKKLITIAHTPLLDVESSSSKLLRERKS